MMTGQYPTLFAQCEIVRVMGFIAYFDSLGARVDAGKMYDELPRASLAIRRLGCRRYVCGQ